MSQFTGIARSFSLVAAVCVGWAQAPVKTTEVAQVESLLANSCVSCHSGTQAAGKLRLDSLAEMSKGGAAGPVVVPGHSESSSLFQRVSTSDRALRMPPAIAPLSADKISLLKTWIDGGAIGIPRVQLATSSGFRSRGQADSAGRLFQLPYRPKSEISVASGCKGERDERRSGRSGDRCGNSAGSRLIQRVEGRGNEKQMPLGGTPLRAEQIATLRNWIDAGAVWPAGAGDGVDVPIQKHWSYVKPVRPPVPSCQWNDAEPD